MRAPALMMMGTPIITDTADGGGGGGGGGQLPVAPLPDGLKDAPEETQQRYFKEAKRVAIEKCRTHRCGNDEVTAKTHLGPEIFITEEDAALLGRTEWKRPSLTACTAQEFAYDFFKFHENRGEFDYESLWDKLDRLISRSGKPFDLLTFYAEVCRRGGFGRDRHDAKTRFSITKVFKVMFNCFEGHSYTDIGNKLFDVYELFFSSYEKAHAEEDVSKHSEYKNGVPQVQDIAHQFYYLRERKEVEKAQIAMHLRRGKKYDPNFVPMFRMSVPRSLLEENADDREPPKQEEEEQPVRD